MQSPTPGSTLSGYAATFTWSADTNATAPGTVPGKLADLPDGNGGTVHIWEETTITDSDGLNYVTAATVFFQDSTTGITYQSSNLSLVSAPLLPNWVLGATGLLYFVGAQMGCPPPAQYRWTFTCGDVLVAMNLNTGTEAWRIPLDSTSWGGWSGQEFGTPAAATADGGLVLTGGLNFSGASNVAGAARVDVNGNMTTDADLGQYIGITNYWFETNPLSYLGGPDGTLWASTTSNAVVSDAVDADETGGDTVSDWMTPSGKGNAFRAELKAHFKDASTNLCGGFDGKPGPGKHAPAILVVPVNGSNQVILKIKGSWQNYTLRRAII
jgi:hypothetical protein